MAIVLLGMHYQKFEIIVISDKVDWVVKDLKRGILMKVVVHWKHLVDVNDLKAFDYGQTPKNWAVYALKAMEFLMTYAIQVNVILTGVKYIINFSVFWDLKCLTNICLTRPKKELMTTNSWMP